jgi:hypothetical protein
MCRKLLGPEAPLSKKIWIESYPSKRNPLDRLGKKKNIFTNYGLSYSEFPEGLSACMFDFDRGEQP